MVIWVTCINSPKQGVNFFKRKKICVFAFNIQVKKNPIDFISTYIDSAPGHLSLVVMDFTIFKTIIVTVVFSQNAVK